MTIEFVIAHAGNDSAVSCAAVREALIQAFDTEGLDNTTAEIHYMIAPKYWRDEADITDKEGNIIHRCVLGFSLELPDPLGASSDLIDGFIDNLRAEPLTAHVVRFEDPSLFTQLQNWSQEIFELEMRLRRALTMIYLVAPFASEPYDLLNEETVKTQITGQKEQMKSAVENEFFHLLFSSYPSLNVRPEPKIEKLIKSIKLATDFTALQNELLRTPVEKDPDLGLLANLKQYSKPVEDMRNCVAHYRRPSRKIIEAYDNAKSQLSTILTAFLVQLRIVDEE